VDARCPHCRGAVRPDAPWCTQCWADLRARPTDVEPVPPVHPVLPAPTAAQPGPAAAGRGWPCGACASENAVELDVCAACGTAFLSGLRAQEAALLTLPVVGDLARLGRGKQYGLAAAAVLAVALLTLLLGLLTG
jgi:hypothetical protein